MCLIEAKYHRSDKIIKVGQSLCQFVLSLKVLFHLFQYYFRFKSSFSEILFDINQ